MLAARSLPDQQLSPSLTNPSLKGIKVSDIRPAKGYVESLVHSFPF